MPLYYESVTGMDLMKLLDILDEHFGDAELVALCRQFGVAFGAFPGESRRDKIREFLGFIKRQGRMAGLTETAIAQRPDLTTAIAELYAGKETELSWLDEVAGGSGQALDSGLTWRWTAGGARLSQTPAPTPGPLDDATNAPLPDPEPPIPTVMINPYTPGKRVNHDAMFFGRETEQAQIEGQLSAGANIAIVGARTVGSSSLLYHLAQAMETSETVLVAHIDLKDPTFHTVAGLLNSIWTQWWSRVRPGNPVPARTLAEYVTAVRKLKAAGFRPLLFLDELEQMVWRSGTFNDELFNAWHELGREAVMGFVVTAHDPPADLLAQSGNDSEFYDLFQLAPLGLFDRRAAYDLLTLPIQNAGLRIPDGAVETLYLHAGPHPFFLQLAGYYLFDALAKGSYSQGEVVRRFEMAAEPYWREMWESLSPLAQEHLPTSMMREIDGMGGRQLRILANRGLVVPDEDGFRPFSGGFAGWLARMKAAVQAAAEVVPYRDLTA